MLTMAAEGARTDAEHDEVVARVERAVAGLRRGAPVVLDGSALDQRTSQLIVAAAHADAATINRMAADARGLIALALPARRCDQLGLGLQQGPRNGSSGRRFTPSIEARHGVTTGISAEDRAVTIAAAIAADATPLALVVPGHVFPIRAADDGVVAHLGRPEAAVDLVRAAGLVPAAVVCTMLDGTGEVASGAEAAAYAARRGLDVVSPADVLAHRRSVRG